MLKVCSLLLVCVAVVYGEHLREELDKVLAAKKQEIQSMFLGVEQQLSAAQQVAGLFVLEDAQLEMFVLETRAKLRAVQDEVKHEIENTVKEVENLRQTAVENVTMWRKTLQGLKDATQRNQQTLQRMRKEKEDKRLLEVELELHMKLESKAKKELELVQELELENELEIQAEEKLKQLQEVERLQELEKKKMLEREQGIESEQSVALEKEQELRLKLEKSHELEKHQMENECEQSEIPEASSSDLNDEIVDIEKATESPEGAGHESAVKRLLAWYVFAEYTLVESAATICRQFVLPVVAIIGLFLVLTVVIARYNALKQARCNRRVLYSGYPKSYRPKPKPETKPILTDVRPRLHAPVPRHDSGVLTED